MDDEIYQGIGEILVAISPADAEVVLVEAELSPEGDHCKLLFDYLGPSGTKQWFCQVVRRWIVTCFIFCSA